MTLAYGSHWELAQEYSRIEWLCPEEGGPTCGDNFSIFCNLQLQFHQHPVRQFTTDAVIWTPHQHVATWLAFLGIDVNLSNCCTRGRVTPFNNWSLNNWLSKP